MDVPIDAELRLRAKTLDPVLIGSRVREARIRAGITQGEAAGDAASTAYVSRIESGARRPGVELLEQLAERLGTSLAELLAPDTDSPADYAEAARVRLELDYAELELRTGRAEAALVGATSVALNLTAPGELRREGRRLRGEAFEALGDLNAAIATYEDLVLDEPSGIRLIVALTALCRCYRDTGDLSRAVDIGDRATERMRASELAGSPEGVQLALTLAAAHFERGDVSHAERICAGALEAAEQLDSPVARASAYWNSSIIESRQGRVHSALPLAEKALALLEPTADGRNVARLRTQLGIMELRADPPKVDSAVAHLMRSELELEHTSATPVDHVDNQLALARARLLQGQLDLARELAEACLVAASGVAPLVAADAEVVLAQIDVAEERHDVALVHLRSAVTQLTDVGADRAAGEIWLELATLLESLGQMAEALEAYRGATAAAGLSPRPGAPAPRTMRVASIT